MELEELAMLRALKLTAARESCACIVVSDAKNIVDCILKINSYMPLILARIIAECKSYSVTSISLSPCSLIANVVAQELGNFCLCTSSSFLFFFNVAIGDILNCLRTLKRY